MHKEEIELRKAELADKRKLQEQMQQFIIQQQAQSTQMMQQQQQLNVALLQVLNRFLPQQ